jgi:hypothetical protein
MNADLLLMAQADDQPPAAGKPRLKKAVPKPRRPAAKPAAPAPGAAPAPAAPTPAPAAAPAPAPAPAAPGGAPAQPPGPPSAGAPPSPSPAPAPQAPAPQGALPTGEFQPVIHAQNAKITTCMDNILAQSASVIDTAHTAISTWVSAAPNDNVFQSILGLSYPNKGAPNAAAVIFAAPLGPGKCQGQTVQIYPTAQPCSAVQASLIKEGRTIATLQALPVVEAKGGVRDLLLPTAGGGVASSWRSTSDELALPLAGPLRNSCHPGEPPHEGVC